MQKDTLTALEPLNLPEGVLPLAVHAEKNGDMLITCVAYEKEAFAKAELSVGGAVDFVKGVWDSLFAGRIYRMTPSGAVTLEMKSINLPLWISRLENGPLIFSTYKLSFGYFSGAEVVLAVDVLKQQTIKVREMSWKAILPPYKFFPEILVF